MFSFHESPDIGGFHIWEARGCANEKLHAKMTRTKGAREETFCSAWHFATAFVTQQWAKGTWSRAKWQMSQTSSLGPFYMRRASPVRLAGPLYRDPGECLFSLVKSRFVYMRRRASPHAEIPVWDAEISVSRSEKFSCKQFSPVCWDEKLSWRVTCLESAARFAWSQDFLHNLF